MQQDARHDWLAVCAEYYVAYLFSRAGYTVYGGNKWGADLVINKNGQWRLVEIRSTDCNNRPQKKPTSKMKDINIYAEVVVKDHVFSVRFCKVEEDGKRTGHYVDDCEKVFA